MSTRDARPPQRTHDAEIARRPGRSHPPSLLRLAERLVRDEALVERGDVVLCACSGGPDSTALLHVLGRLRSRFHFSLVAHGVDHGLRAEAAAELRCAERVAEALGVPFAITRVSVAPGGNLQARARDARLAALRTAAIAAGARRIATGHTADDRAETVLLRLLRGAGPEGLAALPPSAELPRGISCPPPAALRASAPPKSPAPPAQGGERSSTAGGAPAMVSHATTRAPSSLSRAALDSAALPGAAAFASATAPGRGTEHAGDGLTSAGPAGATALPPEICGEEAEDRAAATRADDGLTLIRPLLLARRVDVAAHLARHAIEVARDPSNQDARFLRVRVRNELLPLLESMSPAIVEHLCALADMLGENARENGALRGLGRAQRLAVARAKKCERPVKLRLSGGRDVVVGFSGDEAVLMPEAGDRPVPSPSRRGAPSRDP